MILKNITDNAKNIASKTNIEDMGRMFKNRIANQDVKSAMTGIMVTYTCSII